MSRPRVTFVAAVSALLALLVAGGVGTDVENTDASGTTSPEYEPCYNVPAEPAEYRDAETEAPVEEPGPDVELLTWVYCKYGAGPPVAIAFQWLNIQDVSDLDESGADECENVLAAPPQYRDGESGAPVDEPGTGVEALTWVYCRYGDSPASVIAFQWMPVEDIPASDAPSTDPQ